MLTGANFSQGVLTWLVFKRTGFRVFHYEVGDKGTQTVVRKVSRPKNHLSNNKKKSEGNTKKRKEKESMGKVGEEISKTLTSSHFPFKKKPGDC